MVLRTEKLQKKWECNGQRKKKHRNQQNTSSSAHQNIASKGEIQKPQMLQGGPSSPETQLIKRKKRLSPNRHTRGD